LAKPYELYGIKISGELVSKITDRIIPNIKELQNRPLELGDSLKDGKRHITTDKPLLLTIFKFMHIM
jgi:hypothetical protein